MPHPIWNPHSRDQLDAWACVPEHLRALIGPDDDRDEIAVSLEQLRFAGLDVLDADVFAMAVKAARSRRDKPSPPPPKLYRVGELTRRRECRSVVYYARIGNRVKIGYSIDVSRRMSAIHAEELLTTEPGGPKLEAERHRQFAGLRTRGEWFRLEEPLISHINGLAAAASG